MRGKWQWAEGRRINKSKQIGGDTTGFHTVGLCFSLVLNLYTDFYSLCLQYVPPQPEKLEA